MRPQSQARDGSQAPLIIRRPELCRLLDWDPRTLDKRLPDLQRHGFPVFCDLLNGWPRAKVLEWLDSRFGLSDDGRSEHKDPYSLTACREKLQGVRL
jgi:hypothetical protein